jgi:hypothetical protein
MHPQATPPHEVDSLINGRTGSPARSSDFARRWLRRLHSPQISLGPLRLLATTLKTFPSSAEQASNTELASHLFTAPSFRASRTSPFSSPETRPSLSRLTAKPPSAIQHALLNSSCDPASCPPWRCIQSRCGETSFDMGRCAHGSSGTLMTPDLHNL